MNKTLFLIMALYLLVVNLSAQQGGYALNFDGTKYVNCGNGASVIITGKAITLEAWIFPTAFSTNFWENVIVNKLSSTVSHGYNLRCGGNGKVEFYVSNTYANSGYAISDEGSIQLNTWSHLAGTYDGTNVKLYINGKLVKTTPFTLDIAATDWPLCIGNHGYPGYPERPFIGKIDEVRVWNIARTEAEIKANMYKEIGTHTNLKAYYQMSNGSGASLTDNSGNSNTGTLTNGPTWKVSGCFAGSRQALDFDGSNDYIDCGIDQNLLVSSFTVSAWVYPETSVNNSGVAGAHGEYSGGPGGIIFLQFEDHQWACGIGNSSAFQRVDIDLPLNQWSYITMVYSSNNFIKVYSNGILIGVNNSISTLNPATDSYFWIGRAYDATNRYFDGKIDEFSVWTEILTESEIREIMFKSLEGNESGLFAYYRFDHADGTTLYDMTSNGHNGTLTNMYPATDWVSSSAFNTWLGGESNAWNTAANWSNGVPSSAQSAGIYNWSSALPDVTTLPVIPASVTINNLLVPSGVTASGNVKLTATGSVFLGSSLTLEASVLNTADNLVVESGNTLTLPTGGQLTVARQLDNEGSLIINSGGSLITNGTLTNSGTMQVSRTMSQSIWHLISVPVQGATANTFLGDYLQSWDETNGVWVNISEPTTPLNTKQGYLLWATPAKSDAPYTFTGTLLTGDQSTPITYHAVAGKEFDGANLLGNPYPSSIDWDQLQATYGSNYIWDGTAYKAYSTQSGYDIGYRYIPPMQGFFIIANADGNFNLTNTARTHTGATNFYKSSGSKSFSNGMVLEASNGNYSDEWCLVFNPEASEHFELPRDARKLISPTPGISQLWSESPDGKLAIDIRPESEFIQLGFANDQAGIYTISLKAMADISGATLADTKTGKFHDLTKNAYEFAWEVNDAETRFKLHLNSVGMEEMPVSGTDMLVYFSNGRLVINGVANGDVQVSDLTGKMVLQQKISGEGIVSIPATLQKGLYLVTVHSGRELKTEKVFFR